MNAKVKALLASYARSVLSAAVALYLSGVTDPTKLLTALAAGLLPVAIRYINPKDPAFGRVAEVAVANLTKGEPLIPKDILDKNKDIVDKLVAEAAKPGAKKPAPKKTPTPKNTPNK